MKGQYLCNNFQEVPGKQLCNLLQITWKNMNALAREAQFEPKQILIHYSLLLVKMLNVMHVCTQN